MTDNSKSVKPCIINHLISVKKLLTEFLQRDSKDICDQTKLTVFNTLHICTRTLSYIFCQELPLQIKNKSAVNYVGILLKIVPKEAFSLYGNILRDRFMFATTSTVDRIVKFKYRLAFGGRRNKKNDMFLH